MLLRIIVVLPAHNRTRFYVVYFVSFRSFFFFLPPLKRGSRAEPSEIAHRHRDYVYKPPRHRFIIPSAAEHHVRRV